ncbi:hypothetical protein BKA63DRAFT_219565 [Paraphoma chrysanthemicola]|nr:hypothetical protein BKA63DRAFT_219565 [Paraphoma chrysanthemicola]
MPTSKSPTLPKGWPPGVSYLHGSFFSPKLDANKIDSIVILKSDLPPSTHIFSTKGPYANVKITPVSDTSHPACGQHALFSTQHLPPDSFILPYLGRVHAQSDADPASDYDLSLDRDLGIGVDAASMGNEARFINDFRGVATAPNAEFRDIFVNTSNGKAEKRVGVFVLNAGKSGKRARGIGRGQEILVSYGKGFWTERRVLQK